MSEEYDRFSSGFLEVAPGKATDVGCREILK
jgi:hypothetical protein